MAAQTLRPFTSSKLSAALFPSLAALGLAGLIASCGGAPSPEVRGRADGQAALRAGDRRAVLIEAINGEGRWYWYAAGAECDWASPSINAGTRRLSPSRSDTPDLYTYAAAYNREVLRSGYGVCRLAPRS